MMTHCPWCEAPVYWCEQAHTDGDGPRYHCTAADGHNFPASDREVGERDAG